MISAEDHNVLEQRSCEIRLRSLELEIELQRQTITLISARLGSQDVSLSSLKASLALMAATWRSEIGLRLSEITGRIQRAGNDDIWSVLRSGGERLQGEFSRHIDERGPALTELEARVGLLLAMELTAVEIATTLNLSAATIETTCLSIRGKLEQRERGGMQRMAPSH